MKRSHWWLWIGVIAACAGSARAESGETLKVASKSFTESVVLAELVSALAREAGGKVEHRAGLGGTRLLWEALLAGEIDVYPEYTGTLSQEVLRTGELAPALAARGLAMLGPLGFNNTYALGMREDAAAKWGIARISDLRHHGGLRYGFSNEFMSRADGWPGLRAAYQLDPAQVTGLDHDLAYRGLVAGAIDVVDLYATDAEIAQHRLRVLQDDRRHFPRYDAILVYRRDAERRFPAVFTELRRLTGAVSETQMAGLNAAVKIGRKPESAVAAGFLASHFGAKARAVSVSRGSRILERTVEHLGLVTVSLLAAISFAIPLGVVAARSPALARILLGAVGIVQTVPSLALLVFMVPLFGIGSLPAVLALFLYSLLPIVRNTHAGVVGVPPTLRESAEALGLPRQAILRRIELPLASPSVLAGIKSAAVINVGTATLGALVGAGGYGQPILTGVRLADAGLILEGAVPASLLALAVSGAFDLLERWVVPRGLRIGRSA
ncbi:MAG TPA: glycine betaine ABC transporter substrate-binding protein [Polyangia bacterium]